jgi:hypothetical protein
VPGCPFLQEGLRESVSGGAFAQYLHYLLSGAPGRVELNIGIDFKKALNKPIQPVLEKHAHQHVTWFYPVQNLKDI